MQSTRLTLRWWCRWPLNLIFDSEMEQQMLKSTFKPVWNQMWQWTNRNVAIGSRHIHTHLLTHIKIAVLLARWLRGRKRRQQSSQKHKHFVSEIWSKRTKISCVAGIISNPARWCSNAAHPWSYVWSVCVNHSPPEVSLSLLQPDCLHSLTCQSAAFILNISIISSTRLTLLVALSSSVLQIISIIPRNTTQSCFFAESVNTFSPLKTNTEKAAVWHFLFVLDSRSSLALDSCFFIHQWRLNSI